MGNYNQNGGRHGADENRPSWRPQDQSAAAPRGRGNDDDHDYGSWRDRNQDRQTAERDPDRWEGSRGSELGHSEGRGPTERYGQGQSGYSAGRYGEDRAQSRQMQNRNEMTRGASSREERDLGIDDRFTGRGEDRGYGAPGSESGHGLASERGGSWRAYDPPQNSRISSMGGDGPRGGRGGYEQNMGYQGGMGRQGESMDYRRGQGGQGYGNPGFGSQGYGGSQVEDGSHGTQDDPHRMAARGQRRVGPHRGKGPAGYQRSDERIREQVCEALADDEHIDASHIHVEVQDGEVTLTGTVDDRRTRREAEDCVAAVSGVRDVLVQLRVRDDRQGQGMRTSGGAMESASQSGSAPSGRQGSSSGTSQASGSSFTGSSTGASSAQQGASKQETETPQDKKPRA